VRVPVEAGRLVGEVGHPVGEAANAMADHLKIQPIVALKVLKVPSKFDLYES
jgi:hypothetical protein